MKEDMSFKLTQLREDYAHVTGRVFEHFFCPVLYVDEEAELCRAHIVNESFRNSVRCWTIQRKDVDGFYGYVFEGDFVELQDRGAHRPVEVIADRDLTRRLRPQITAGGKPVEHYIAKGPIPPAHSEIRLDAPTGSVRLGLKLSPDETLALVSQQWEINIAKDVRLASMVSLIKAAYLTMFELIGYEYALSAGGHFVGHNILGTFFRENAGKPKPEILEAARHHFPQFMNMVRPIGSAPDLLTGTVSDRYLFLCRGSNGPWGIVVIVRTGTMRHAVLLPALEHVESAVRFDAFLRDPPRQIEVTLARFERDRWDIATKSTVFEWPQVQLE